jgi:hypothetical protein
MFSTSQLRLSLKSGVVVVICRFVSRGEHLAGFRAHARLAGKTVSECAGGFSV